MKFQNTLTVTLMSLTFVACGAVEYGEDDDIETGQRPLQCSEFDEDECAVTPQCHGQYIAVDCPLIDCPEGADCAPPDCQPVFVCEPVEEPPPGECADLGEAACIDAHACTPLYEEVCQAMACAEGEECDILCDILFFSCSEAVAPPTACELLDEDTCHDNPSCEPIYSPGECETLCEDGGEEACVTVCSQGGYEGCVEGETPIFCHSDADCEGGYCALDEVMEAEPGHGQRTSEPVGVCIPLCDLPAQE